MNPRSGFELKASSSLSAGPGSSALLNSTDVKYTWLSCGFSFSSGLLMKMFVPPPKDAYNIPLGSSDWKNDVLAYCRACSL